MTQGSDYSALTRIEESYYVGDVLIASTAVIGNGVRLLADPGCSITIREGACLGPDVLIHASQGAIEVHQGVCIARGVLIIGAGHLGKQVCVGADSTLINPCFPEGTIISCQSLWGDESRPGLDSLESPMPKNIQEQVDKSDNQVSAEAAEATNQTNVSQIQNSPEVGVNSAQGTSSTSGSTVIGRQQFEMMLLKMFPDRNAFKQSQT